eukprot:529980-Prymnesium_polylepis.1
MVFDFKIVLRDDATVRRVCFNPQVHRSHSERASHASVSLAPLTPHRTLPSSAAPRGRRPALQHVGSAARRRGARCRHQVAAECRAPQAQRVGCDARGRARAQKDDAAAAGPTQGEGKAVRWRLNSSMRAWPCDRLQHAALAAHPWCGWTYLCSATPWNMWRVYCCVHMYRKKPVATCADTSPVSVRLGAMPKSRRGRVDAIYTNAHCTPADDRKALALALAAPNAIPHKNA